MFFLFTKKGGFRKEIPQVKSDGTAIRNIHRCLIEGYGFLQRWVIYRSFHFLLEKNSV